MEILLDMVQAVKDINKLYSERHERTLDLHRFNDNYLRLHTEKIEFAKPETMLKVYKTFDDKKDQKKYVDSILQNMKENKVDARKFRF